ncbi:MAG: glycoside hydrolase family 1 protein [Candidatus Falkowbacteria bacterium]
MSKQKELKFPKNFLWGTSTSAYQVEGGIKNDWSDSGRDAGKACDSYNRYGEDFDLAKKLNNNAIRFGIEWARIEPEEGKFNMKEIEHYRKVLESAKKRNLKIVLTLWHWTNPIWLAEIGGWGNKKVIEYFSRYTKLIVDELGDYVDYWVTLNEPMVHVANGYTNGKFPPNRKNIFKANSVLKNLANSHNASYKIIHKKYPRAKVSITALINYFEPARKWFPDEILFAGLFHYFWNDRFLQKIKNHIDYIGVDYYFHDRIVWYPPFKKNLNKKTTDLGWEIFPEGIYHVLKYLKKYHKPILILENGLADERDKYRADFIKDHLFYVHKAISEGVPVRGYFHWSLLDNFEWAEGYGPKFGLYSVDGKTFARKPRPSVKEYNAICRSNSIKIK